MLEGKNKWVELSGRRIISTVDDRRNAKRFDERENRVEVRMKVGHDTDSIWLQSRYFYVKTRWRYTASNKHRVV